MKKASLRIALSLGVAGLLLACLLVFGDVDLREVGANLRRMPPSVFFTALGIHVGIYVFRALRFRLLLPHGSRPRFGRLMVLTAAHNMASYLMPAKTGEASWLIYMKSQCGVGTSSSLASLVIARMLDGAVLCGSLALACLMIGLSHEYDDTLFQETEAQVFLATVGSGLALLVVVFLALAWRADLLLRLLTVTFRYMRLHHWSAGEKVVAKLYQASVALRDAGKAHLLGGALLCSIPIWLGVFSFYDLLGNQLGLESYDKSFVEMIFGSSLAVAANLLPVNGVAGAGTQEGGWLLGFGMLGVPKTDALQSSLGAHAVQLFNVVAMGMIAHVFMGLLPRVDLGGGGEEDEPAEPELPPFE